MNNKISLIRCANLATVDYAYASHVPSGKELIFLAGACPINEAGVVDAPEDYEQQARLCMENLKAALKECGASLNDVAYTRVLVASQNRSDLVMAWKIIRKEFDDHDVPSTLSGVTVLGYDNQLVEIEAVAGIDKLK